MDVEPDDLLAVTRRRLAGVMPLPGPATAAEVVRFLLRWHHLAGAAATGPAAVAAAVAGLEGAVLPAEIVETELLATRVQPYEPRWIDELCASGEVRWVGAGEGRVVLARREVAGLLFPLFGLDGEPSARLDGPVHTRIRSVLATSGSSFFRDLGGVEYTDAETLSALWELVWAGEVTGDGFAALRAAVAPGGIPRPASGLPGARLRARPRPGSLRAGGPPAGQGRWSLVSGFLREGGTRAAPLVLADALLQRYGVLTRDAVRSEGVPGGWGGLLPGLELLEASGLARRGDFVSGGGDPQFAAPDAVRLIGAPAPIAGTCIVSAADPGSAYGAAVPWPADGPTRTAGSYVVFVAGEGSLYVERGGRGVVALRRLDGTWEADAVEALVRAVRPGQGTVRPGGGMAPRWRRLALEKVPVGLEPYLSRAGFVPTPKGLVLYG